jgi:micrococcal nuclease
MYEYSGTVIKVIDADTVDIKVDLGFKISFVERFRLYGIDAWETRGVERPKGLLAKEYLIERLEEVENCVTIVTIKDKKGKYGRYLANIIIGEEDLNAALVVNGHAEFKEY